MPLSQAAIDRTFDEIVRCAIAGERCPVNAREGCKGFQSNATNALADAGRIKIEVYALNWRVVEIMVGPHKGKRTAPPTFGCGEPYVIKYRGKTLRRPTQRQPQPATAPPPPMPRPRALGPNIYRSNFEPT